MRSSSCSRRVSILAVLGLALAACTYDFGVFDATRGDGGPSDGAADGSGDDSSGDDGAASPEGGDSGSGAPDSAAGDALADASESGGGDAARDSSRGDADSGPLYTVGGMITGLAASGLRLSNSGGPPLTLPAGLTSFAFPAQPDGTSYSIAIVTQPTGESCSVSGGSGKVNGANVTSVQIACIATPACAPTCPDGNLCGAPSDCGSLVCTASVCRAPACAPNCHHGEACGAGTDCKSGTCNAGKCQ